MPPIPSSVSLWDTARRVGVAVAIVAGAYVLWRLGYVLMLLFAAVLLAVVLRAAAQRISGSTGLPRGLSMALATLVLVGVLAAFVYLFGLQLAQQLQGVLDRLPAALERLASMLKVPLSPEALRAQAGRFASSGLPGAVGYGTTAIAALADAFVVVVGGIYLASDARTYRRGAALLLPEPLRSRLTAAAGDAAQALTKWFVAQLVAMAAVGAASWAAYAWIGLPSAGTLGLIAGIANFVPVVGPLVGAVPALVVATGQGAEAVWWTLGAAVAIQQLESYLLVPAVQKRAIDLPPAVGIFALVVFGTLFGVIGVVLAVPLAVVIMVGVQRLWVNEALGGDVAVIGTTPDKPDAAAAAAAAPLP